MGNGCDDGIRSAEVSEDYCTVAANFERSFNARYEENTNADLRSPRPASAQALIERAVEVSVLTTLLRRHGSRQMLGDSGDVKAKIVSSGMPQDMATFIALLVDGDAAGASGWLMARRHPSGLLDDTAMDVLTLAARRLGTAWDEDGLSFAEVSLGLVTLQRILKEFTAQPIAASFAERRILIVTMPGDTHCFGARMLAIRFCQAGWDGRCEADLSEEALLEKLGEEHFDVVGVSVAIGRSGGLGALVRRLREVSRNRDLRVLLGGAHYLEKPEAPLKDGADLPVLPFAELCQALDCLVPAAG
jgi:MerR family transcriptional regulator, light-induced transcriptional regulator